MVLGNLSLDEVNIVIMWKYKIIGRNPVAISHNIVSSHIHRLCTRSFFLPHPKKKILMNFLRYMFLYVIY